MSINTFTQVAYGHAAIVTQTLHEALAAANGDSDQFAESWELIEELNQSYAHITIESFYSETAGDYILSIRAKDHTYIPESKYADLMPVRLVEPQLNPEVTQEFIQIEQLLGFQASERGWFFMQIVS